MKSINQYVLRGVTQPTTMPHYSNLYACICN